MPRCPVATFTSCDCRFYVSDDGVLTRSPSPCNADDCTGTLTLNHTGIQSLGDGVFEGLTGLTGL